MNDATRRIAAFECARQRLARRDDRLKRRLVALAEEKAAIEQACDAQRACLHEVDTAIDRERSQIGALTADGRSFSIEVLMQGNRGIDALVQQRMVLAIKLERLNEESTTKEDEMVQVRREAAMNQFRDRIIAARTEAMRNEMAAHRERHEDEEIEEIAFTRRLAAGRIDE
ncbi:hypothetical protein [Burkholderia ubonensis]|uniref:hypothetical protein n=1 Tax=Burkholderia ubonensis TaxID=101571 RepID=UPI000AE31261|nr:hypothetical protein [Burkholderia ubonensis]